MEFILTTIFILLLTMFLYGYFSYFNVKKHLPKCDVIYILHDGFDDNPDPDFYHGNSDNLYKIKQK